MHLRIETSSFALNHREKAALASSTTSTTTLLNLLLQRGCCFGWHAQDLVETAEVRRSRRIPVVCNMDTLTVRRPASYLPVAPEKLLDCLHHHGVRAGADPVALSEQSTPNKLADRNIESCSDKADSTGSKRDTPGHLYTGKPLFSARLHMGLWEAVSLAASFQSESCSSTTWSRRPASSRDF